MFTARFAIPIAVGCGLLLAQASDAQKVVEKKNRRPAADSAFSQKVDGKAIKWNAILTPADEKSGHKFATVDVIVDLTSMSILKTVTSMAVTVDLMKDGKRLKTDTLTFPLEKLGAIACGQKVEYTFEIKDPAPLPAGTTLRLGEFSGTVDTHMYVYQQDRVDPYHGKA